MVKVEDNVTFGFRLGGSTNNPIILQAREKTSEINIGSGSTIMNGCEFFAFEAINIGTNCLIGARCTFIDSDGHGINPHKRKEAGSSSPIIIGDNVWLGFGCTVLKGCKIGENSVVGARCVVTKDLPDGSIAVGSPMKVIGSVWDKKYE